ncbi:hypothetical protein TWF730_008897 [Orbilia blumenaviensis]|uniref:DNA 3'-5' helicase n=1 Tax=Orbilia blumenaviensis TaxID=1796055 RepID=A0AAV9UXP3_9PEZI
MEEIQYYEATVVEKTRPPFARFGLIEYEINGLLAVVCRGCQALFPSDQVQSHLECDKHKLDKSVLLESGLITLVNGPGWALFKELQDLQTSFRKKHIRPLPHLKVVQGFKCNHCWSCYTTESSLRTHFGRCKEDVREKPRTYQSIREEDKIPCQALFFTKGVTYHPVHPYQQLEVGPGEGEDEILVDLLDIRNRRHQFPDGKSYDLDLSSPVPFLQRTGWTTFCGGDRVFIKERLVELAKQAGRGPVLEKIITTTRSLLHKSLSCIKRTLVHYRRILKAPHEGMDSRPFDRKQVAETENNYLNVMIRMVLYICSISQSEEEIDKSGIQLAVYQDLIDDIFVFAMDQEGEGEVFQEEFEFAILRLIIECVTTPLSAATEDKFEHPTMSFLAVMGFNEEKGVWRSSFLATKAYAAMSFSTRLCILREAWRLTDSALEGLSDADRQLRKDVLFSEAFTDLVRFTKDNQPFPMAEWLGQHAYAKAVTESSFLPGELDWTKDGVSVIFEGEKFHIPDYRKFIKTLYPKIHGLSRQLLHLSPTQPFPTISLDELVDDNPDQAIGYSVVSEPKNAHHYDPKMVLDNIKNGDEGPNYFSPTGILSHKAMKAFLHVDGILRAWFAVAMLLTSGEPPRGTELLSWRKYNTPINPRNIFVRVGDVLLFGTYNKTQAMTGVGRGICRFLPADIGEALMVYLFKIDPVVELFRDRLGYKQSPLLFCDEKGNAWSSEFLSNFMKKAALESMGFPLKLKNYRQIIAGITRQYVLDMAKIIDKQVEEMKSKFAEQMGHGDKTDLLKYGASQSRMPDTSEISLNEFRRATVQLQFFIGAIDRLPDWMFEPSKVWWPNFDAPDRHPRFRHPAFPAPYVIEEIPANAPRIVAPLQPAVTAVALPTAPAALTTPTQLTALQALVQETTPAALHQFAPTATTMPGLTRTAVATTFYMPDPRFPRRLHQELAKQYGKFGRPGWKLPEQAAAAKAIYQRNVSPLLVTLACAAGKTTAALLAIAAGNGVSIIIEPFIATCKDVARRAEAMGINTQYWGDTENPGRRKFSKKIPGVIIATPEAAIMPGFRSQVAKFILERRLDVLIIDEVHQPLLDQGFRDLAALARYTNIGVPFVCMTATMPPLMVSSLQAFYSISSFQEIRSTTNIKNISYRVEITTGVTKKVEDLARATLKIISKQDVKDQINSKIIIYCRSIGMTNSISSSLKCPKYSGEMTVGDRERNLQKWNKNGGVLVATTCLGPGVDTKGVISVIHGNIPWTLVEFVQQTARAGREGQPMAFSTLVCGKPEFDEVMYYDKPQWCIESHKALVDMITTTGCRRLAISQFMDGKGKSVDCFTLNGVLCDNCNKLGELGVEEGEEEEEEEEEPEYMYIQAEVRQANAIFKFLRASDKLCSYCFFVHGSLGDHTYSQCQVTTVPLEVNPFPDAVCTHCGIPKYHCTIESQHKACINFRACRSIYHAVWDDIDLRGKLFVELGIQDLRLKTWDDYETWLGTTWKHKKKETSNAWRLLQGLEKLHFFSVFAS